MAFGYADESLTEPEPTWAERSRGGDEESLRVSSPCGRVPQASAKMKTGDQRDHMLKIAKVWDRLAEDRADMLCKRPQLVQAAEKPLST